jgi:vanillate/3-O-methylgallate O-demethylase
MVQSLQELLESAGGAINYARSHKYELPNARADVFPVLTVPAVPQEFSLWEREGMGYRESVSMFDQTHHMTGLLVEGADAQEFLGRLSCNRLHKSPPGTASQLLCVDDEGRLIGDGIAFHQEDGSFRLYAGTCINWIHYNAEHTDLDVKVTRDDRSPGYPNGHAFSRPFCRYQLQGPAAPDLIRKLTGLDVSDMKLFKTVKFEIAGHECGGLRHGMAGAPGLEIWADWEVRDDVRGAIIEAGREFGLRLAGSMSYLVTALESGWYKGPLPAIFSNAMKPYRGWLPGNYREGMSRLSGSAAFDSIDDYYLTPFDLGYDRLLDLEHDCVGREALRQMQGKPPRKKVTLQWIGEDVGSLITKMMTPGGPDIRMLHLPGVTDKIDWNFDTITKNGKQVGLSTYMGYSVGERSVLSQSFVDADVEYGDEVVVHWGEAGGGFDDRIVAPTEIHEIRAIVSPATPFKRVGS